MSGKGGKSTGGVYDSSAGDTNFRRKWDREEYAERAKTREKNPALAEKNDSRRRRGLAPQDDEEEHVEKELLKARDTPIDLTSNLNKTQIVQSTGGQQPGFYCAACDCTVKDSVNYLDHINGAKHQKNLGMSMQVERSTAQQVAQKLASLKRKKEVPELDFDARVEKAKAEEEEEKRARKREKREKKRKHKEPTVDPELAAEDIDIASMMGFGNFGGGKKG
ncbi:hypothetical protein HDU87_001981 [Geranomyces variabilis]|uniref:U1-type domain-containing protein n=1 Tax=Geranomyces variabilis TaxID=109894 RepID=A0AAD5XSB1_9FUNG|nr:hypothetical protein HDU87_001981 [Geranomyces variabilis]